MVRKLQGCPVEYDRRFAGARVYMVEGLLVLCVDAMAVSVVVASASELRSVFRWSCVYG